MSNKLTKPEIALIRHDILILDPGRSAWPRFIKKQAFAPGCIRQQGSIFDLK
jgi:hypothetical protein